MFSWVFLQLIHWVHWPNKNSCNYASSFSFPEKKPFLILFIFKLRRSLRAVELPIHIYSSTELSYMLHSTCAIYMYSIIHIIYEHLVVFNIYLYNLNVGWGSSSIPILAERTLSIKGLSLIFRCCWDCENLQLVASLYIRHQHQWTYI